MGELQSGSLCFSKATVQSMLQFWMLRPFRVRFVNGAAT